jgi:hypothetical protein
MTSKQRRIARMSLKLCVLAVAIFLTYQGGYALGRKRGKADHPITLKSLVALITGVTTEETEIPSGDPFGANPFGEFSSEVLDDPFGGAK